MTWRLPEYIAQNPKASHYDKTGHSHTNRITAALAVYKTTTTREQLDYVADAHCIIATPTPIPTQLEPDSKATTTIYKATMAPELPDCNTCHVTTLPALEQVQIEADPAATEWHRDEEREMGRVEKLKEDKEEAPEMRVKVLALDIEEQETIGMTQSEVQDPAPSPTARLAFDAMLHESTRFDWAAEVDEALGLSPVAPSNSTTPTPINPIPNDAMVDPVHVTFANPVPRNSTTTPSVHSDPISIHPAFRSPVPVDPDPGDMATSPTGTTLTKSNTAPTNPDRIPPKSATPPIVNDETSTTLLQFVHAPLKRTVNPVPGDVAVDPVRAALASTIPTDLVIPSCVATNECTHIRFANAVLLASSILTDPVRTALTNILPAIPVPVDLADSNLITVTISFAFITLSGIKLICRAVKNHLYLISLTHVGVF
ncbi:hypothetical protein PILCRDRAFT_93215 [Piloderma croceum F 1598]|uniref:Uncharacterized protein n=1 Tax=Piloderma croceum (strain F 1598) TaxID=765440 RepID=A0A0C3B6W5_PILCF|nr:hypothetical protein PILCRDRAFT_93215 [Piloderma croceum F 1598]